MYKVISQNLKKKLTQLISYINTSGEYISAYSVYQYLFDSKLVNGLCEFSDILLALGYYYPEVYSKIQR